MATKRPAPKDFDTPPLQAKQPRVESGTAAGTSTTQPFLFTSRTLSLPLQALPGRTSIPAQSTGGAALIGITGILPTTSPIHTPGTPQFDLLTQVTPTITTPSVLPLSARPFPTRLAGISPSAQAIHPFTVAAAAIGIQSLRRSHTPPAGVATLQSQFVTSPSVATSLLRPGATSTPVMAAAVGRLMASSLSASSLHATPPPPYPTSTSEQSSDEFTCSSPSQFLYSPTSLRPPVVSQAAISAATSETFSLKENRQPVCTLPLQLKNGSERNGSQNLKGRIIKHKKSKLAELKLRHETQLKERFFLEGAGNMMEFVIWKKKPNILRDQYLEQHDMESETHVYDDMLSPTDLSQPRDSSNMDTEGILRDESLEIKASAQTPRGAVQKKEKMPKVSTPKSMHLRPEITASPTKIQIPLSTVSPSFQVAVAASTPKSTPTSPASRSLQVPTPLPRPATRAHASFSVYESSHEDIVMRARHEAEVMRAIADLRKEGLWSSSRLPKVREPPRMKTHWDYLLEEMQWLATDFANERRWKMTAAKKLCRSVARQYLDHETHHVRLEKEELLRLRRVAAGIAKEVKHFWESIQKIVEHKQNVLLEEKRKKAMDMHLEFIVDQTQKYSNWLVKGLASKTPSEPSLQSVASRDDFDAFLTPSEGGSDDEETIDVEEKQAEREGSPNYAAEIQQLEAESELPLEQLLASLPKEMVEGASPAKEGEKGEEVMETDEPAEEKPKTRTRAILEERGRRETRSRSAQKEAAPPVASTTPPATTVPPTTTATTVPPTATVPPATTVPTTTTAPPTTTATTVPPTATVPPTTTATTVPPTTTATTVPPATTVSPAATVPPASAAATPTKAGADKSDDADYEMSESEEEDETTIVEQETHEGAEVDHKAEVNALQEEGELPLEELLRLYNLERPSATPETDVGEEEASSKDPSEMKSPGDSEAEESDAESISEGEEEGEGEGDHGIELLVSGKSLVEACQTEEGLSNVAAAAERFQPKGITLATTEVKTKVPFLLRHTLREYQHIGLDWLVAMDERRLNGILADEMGLGKTMQTIALLAHLACDKGNWGPHLIIVPTSVMLNWECELKKWCPAFKILTYFGSFKERKQKRVGWTKRNAFHVCITSYNIAVQDHRSFKQKKWKYLVLDEAQNIKNFKSQRWQTLLNFNSQRRLLLTGTPLQNNLMELWSLMHFLMPTVFASHADFKEWFSNPLTGMVEGSQEYNESIVRRLHQVLRPFLLRRLKMEVEKQMPKKFEHLVLCQLSKRQRFLYNEYMGRTKTKDTLAAGNFLSVINILMQLRKVCNHPDLFEPRPIVSPFRMAALEFYTASLVLRATEYDPFKHINLDCLNLHLAKYELELEAFAAFRARQLQASRVQITDSSHLLPEMGEGQMGGASTFLEDLHLPPLASKRQEWSFLCRKHMHEVNTWRCRRQPMYGSDLIRAVRTVYYHENTTAVTKRPPPFCPWLWSGYAACTLHQSSPQHWSNSSTALGSLLLSHQERAVQMEDIIQRFVIIVPPVTTPSSSPSLHTYHPHPSWLLREMQRAKSLVEELSPRGRFLHPVATRTTFQFPETRLIQYDCGKLQTLDILLHRLKAEGHRVLIFTQMARMLDVLEIFLNYHAHTYLRLDGATPVQKRQILMERFNRDERVFCFILSTRSGGLGVNLTGADTVVFYDSDWNPTMDAQAQDRCHRIGQTRDVHIYRLVCESTVEENILKKANQKRLLGNIAIEGGSFTTDFFKQSSLQDLFTEEPLPQQAPPQPLPQSGEQIPVGEPGAMSQKQIEELLLQAEDDTDVKAMHLAKAEQAAEMAEFDENFSAQTATSGKEERRAEPKSKVLVEFARIEDQLSGVERYAMRFLEAENAEFAAEQLRIAEENIELAKKDWELSHLQSLREEEERLAEEDADDVLLTYDRPEMANKIYVDETTGEEMPIWLPPTPPADDKVDLYVDLVLDMAYDTSTTMSTVLLATIAPYSEDDYDVFGLWRRNMETVAVKKAHKAVTKQAKEHVNVPPSLFWRRAAADSLSTKLRRLSTHPKKVKSKDQFTPLLEQQPEGPEWSYFEDWVLLKGITTVLEFPLSLTISVPAQIPNWSIVASLTSTLSKVKRSPLQCREHLLNVVIPREDHSTKGDEHETKKYKSRDSSVKKSKGRKDQRTKNLVLHDNGKELTRQFTQTFSWFLQTSNKRKQTPKFKWEAVQKPSMHAELLKDYGVNMDSVQSPMQIALQRTERIQSELPRHSQMHQLLAGQAQQYSHISQQLAARGFHAGTSFIKPTVTDISKAGYSLPLIRQTGGVSLAPTATQQFTSASTNSGTIFSAASKIPQVVAGIPSSLPLPTASQVPNTVGTPSSYPSSSASLVTKTFSVSSGMSEFGKTILPLAAGRAALNAHQLMLLRGTALQQQHQAASTQISTHRQPQTVQPAQAAQIVQKIPLPTGIDQLRSSVALPQQRLAVTTSTVSAIRAGLTGTGRTLPTEDVLALLKAQSMRNFSQAYKATHAAQLQAREAGMSLQLKSEGGLQLSKQTTPGEGGVKFVQNPTLEGGQLKVELVDQSQVQQKLKAQAQQQQPQKQQQLQSLKLKQLQSQPRQQQQQAEPAPAEPGTN